MGDYIGILGMAVILGIAYAFSSNRKAINLRVVGAALALQAAIAAFVLYFDWGRNVIRFLSDGVLAIISYSRAGIDMVFGPLADISIPTRGTIESEYGLTMVPDAPIGVAFSFAINVLPIIIFSPPSCPFSITCGSWNG